MDYKDTVDKMLYLKESQVIDLVNEGKKAGIREVVGYLNQFKTRCHQHVNSQYPLLKGTIVMEPDSVAWQAKLKEWQI